MEGRTRSILASLCFGAVTLGTEFAGSIILVVEIARDLAADVTTSQWILNIYTLSFAMGMATGGRLGDMYGRRRLLFIGLAVFALASLGCALAPSIGWLIAARALQGFGPAIVWPNILGMASTVVRPEERGFAIGLAVGSVATGQVLGPMIGSLVIALGAWRLFFVVNVVMCIVAAVVIWRVVSSDTRERPDERIDYAGIAVLSVAILALLYALDVGADWGWTSFKVIGLLLVSGVLFAVLPVLEARVTEPLVPPPMLRNGQFLLALAANGLVVPPAFLAFLYFPQYLYKALDWPVTLASLGTLPLLACLAILSVVSGRIYILLGPRRLLALGYGVTAAGSVGAILIEPTAGYWGLIPALLLLGLGVGLTIGPAGSAAVGAADPSRAGLAGALSFMVHMTCGAIGVAGGTALLFSASAAKLEAGLAAAGISLSGADQTILNGEAPGAAPSQAILQRFGAAESEQITHLVQKAFTAGVNQAFWLALVCALAGVVVAFCLNDDKLVHVQE